MKINRLLFVFFVTFLAVLLAACSSGEKEDAHSAMNHSGTEEMEHMEHSSSGELPEGLKKAETPTFETGSKAILQTDHMKGMNGAEATIAGVFDTTVYAISYTPTTGGERVENHKWIVQEEIKDASGEPYQEGAKVEVEADHMEGMKGSEATIDSAEQTTVYMINYTSTDGEQVKNHKWVTESELSATD
ncbi:YdhK family protein [Planococcus sp. YIM B11945]|uniref:YdhK family protein n=1 Tax=Planococcus sp. YIM B11945 TaxID=3435410 RepID=UPI003D7E1762